MAGTSAITATPTGDGSSYTANAAFGSGTEIATGEYVVSKSASSSTSVSNLTIGTTYHFTVFTRKGSNWSTGVSVTSSPIPELVISEIMDNPIRLQMLMESILKFTIPLISQ